ncbi:MAG: NAD(P)/FAD-dependent oxidoreductase [Defluviitaleaceae bacterium]|nr:NAD(P)/FAD-dependent oxidoreductase [Defluviitaleaceae bacterium]
MRANEGSPAEDLSRAISGAQDGRTLCVPTEPDCRAVTRGEARCAPENFHAGRKRIIVVGGGASGMMAAGTAASLGLSEGHNFDVILCEKNDKLGKKLFITGKGRCNLTNDRNTDEMLENVTANRRFLYSAFNAFGSRDLMDFFEGLGVPLVVERGKRVFPRSGKSSDIVRALGKYLAENCVDIRLNSEVKSIKTDNGHVVGIETKTGLIPADAVIVATGGLSYPATGSTGDGYRFAREAGHTVTDLHPALTPLVTQEKWVGGLMGLSLRNVGVKVLIDGRKAYEDFGEMIFTHFGVSGPVALSAGRAILNKYEKKPVLSIDLKPALNEDELDRRILRDFEKYANKDLRNAMADLLPQRLIPVIIENAGLDAGKKIHDITKDERRALGRALKSLDLTVIGNMGYNEAVITAGGVSVSEINPATMESKIVAGLYFTGEVLDLDAFTGGYNLQIAFSTGAAAGRAASRR